MFSSNPILAGRASFHNIQPSHPYYYYLLPWCNFSLDLWIDTPGCRCYSSRTMNRLSSGQGFFLISGVVFVVVLILAFEGTALFGAPPNAATTPTPPAVASPLAGFSTSTPTPRPTSTSTPVPPPTPTVTYSSTFTFQPMAVMIDNQADARPQTGLGDADVVYEAVTEAGITRFMAIYAHKSPNVVGPIRSARHYFMYWASEYNAIYVHAGSSPQGYDAARSIGIDRIDYTYGEGDFWRSRDRDAPHNLYASIGRLRATVTDKGKGQLSSLKLKHEQPDPQVTEVVIVHPDGYRVAYEYDRATNSYLRFMQRQAHVDVASGLQYNPRNVVVQFVRTWPIPGDDTLRVDMELAGAGGPAYYFLDGRAIKGAWRKDSPTAPTVFRDDSGREVAFNPGQTWIQIVPSESKVTYTGSN